MLFVERAFARADRQWAGLLEDSIPSLAQPDHPESSIAKMAVKRERRAVALPPHSS
jgi:hypothetical protein